MKHPDLDPVLEWLGISVTDEQVGLLEAYASWLATEGTSIGGIGPAEPARLWDRHILDSLVFGTGLEIGATVLDVGSGIGLPAIPLAISRPDAAVTMLDRSQRRTDALRRVVRMLDLSCTVVTEDVSHHDGRYDRVVMRAVLPPSRATHLRRLVSSGGSIVVGVGRADPPSDLPDGSLVRVQPEVLENGAWLLIIPVE